MIDLECDSRVLECRADQAELAKEIAVLGDVLRALKGELSAIEAKERHDTEKKKGGRR